MFLHGTMYVPASLTGKLVREFHVEKGHLGGERLWSELQRRFSFANVPNAKRLTLKVQTWCEICQASEHPHVSLKVPMEHHPIPEKIMDSVALDIFSMPPLLSEGKSYDCFVLCVDILSGWMVAIPESKAGLTGEKVALKCLRTGIPSELPAW